MNPLEAGTNSETTQTETTLKADNTKTKEQITEEKTKEKRATKLATLKTKNENKLKTFLLNKQDTVFATCHIDINGKPEFHKYNTYKDAEEALLSLKAAYEQDQEYHNWDSIYVFSGYVAIFELSRVVTPVQTPKGKKKVEPIPVNMHLY